MINIFKNVIRAIKESQTGVSLILGVANIFRQWKQVVLASGNYLSGSIFSRYGLY